MRKHLLLLLVAVSVCAAAYAQDKKYDYLRIGNPEDISTKTTFGAMLIGGGKDVDAAFQQMCAWSGGGDFLVIRARGTDAYNPYIRDLCKVNSVATLVIGSRETASEPKAAEAIRKAEAIFIAGGDQANYINFWKGTPVQAALNDAIARGVPIGGSSAGLAVLGEFVFAALEDTAYSKVVLASPMDKTVTLERDFLAVPNMKGIITDTHFAARDRQGRLLTFLARILHDGWAKRVRGIAVDERTAVAVSADGKGTVLGDGNAYFYEVSTGPEKCEPGAPLTIRGIAVQKAPKGSTVDLQGWKVAGGASYSLTVEEGVVKSTQAGGALY